MSSMATKTPLVALLDELGYGDELRRERISPPGAATILDFVGFTRAAPQDIRTSAIAASQGGAGPVSDVLAGARRMATPFVLIAGGATIEMYRLGPEPGGDAVVASFDIDRPEDWDVGAFRRELDPIALQMAKSGLRQLTLFPIDVRLLAEARSHSVGSLRTRLESAFAHVLETRKYSEVEAARLVISALAAVIVSHKYGHGGSTSTTIVASALQKHRAYFHDLARWEATDAKTVGTAMSELSGNVDYSAIDARSVNSIYEHLFMTAELRKELGTFYTDPLFASRILEHLPVEEIPPDERCVVDPACGSGNLLLAAQERLEVLAPSGWSAQVTHDWLKTHVFGADVDPIATEIAKLSLLVSALPLGNTWRVEQRDFLADPPTIAPPPTLLVTNPPWHNPKGRRKEKASEFLRGAVNLLSEGGFLACIMPVAWLTGKQHRGSRDELRATCEVFEVWRLPRDMFPDARMGSAVVFARKSRQPMRTWASYRWVTAGLEHRRQFTELGRPSFSAVVPAQSGKSLTWGPVDDVLHRHPASGFVGDVADVSGGIVQRGTPALGRPSKSRIPVLLRGAKCPIYRPLDPASVGWVDSIENFVATEDQVQSLLTAPKILVQADRNPDTTWRVRPILDDVGVVPVGAWQAVVAKSEQEMFALFALLASSPVSCWVHSHAAAKRITTDLIGEIPLPRKWSSEVPSLARLGRALLKKGPSEATISSIETAVTLAYGFNDRDRQHLARIMGGSLAPEGQIRIEQPADRRKDSRAETSIRRAGTVMEVGHDGLRLWLVGDHDEGRKLPLPTHVPGWLCEPGSTFDLEGEPESGHYLFHRTAFMSEEAIFGVEPNDDADR